MVDREKVIKGLECCEDRIQCENCPYGKPRYIGIQGCTRELVHDALALLKEQEAVEPQLSMSGLWYECPICHRHLLKDSDNYCARCGRRLKWE